MSTLWSGRFTAEPDAGVFEHGRSLSVDRRLVDADAPFGIYHGTSSGETTWCGFARAIVAELGMDAGKVQPITTAEFPLPAPRPAYSVLGHRAWHVAGVEPLPHWQDALRRSLSAVVGETR